MYNTFDLMLPYLENGSMITRHSWNDGSCIFKQIPAEIDLDIIPKMQSVPDSVKDMLMSKKITLKYKNQLARLEEDGTVNSWSPSVADIFADDWFIIDITY